MKKLAYLLVIAVLACAAPVFAQGSFTDVPTEHWAYDAISQLQQSGLLMGYPDGTFSGKKAITRYEFAMALARVLTLVEANKPNGGNELPSDLVKKGDLPNFGEFAKTSDIPDVSKFAKQADVDAIKKLVNEFRDELAAIGTDVEAAKRDVAAMDARVAALEAEAARLKITGTFNFIGMMDKNNYTYTAPAAGTLPTPKVAAFDADGRVIANPSSLLTSSAIYKDLDINIVGRANADTTVHATLNYGNYVKSLNGLDTIGVRDADEADAFIPYYMYVDTVVGGAAVTAGRFPIQLTPYTLKKIDVDSYTEIAKTDDGNYPVNGVKAALNVAGVDLTMFAAKHKFNDVLVNGLYGGPTQLTGGPFVGGLPAAGAQTQSAGARATMAVPFNGNLGLTYIQSYSPGLANYDQARVYGADLSVLFLDKYNFAGSYTESSTLVADGVVGNIKDVDYQNAAWDVKVATGFGPLGVTVGYKSIGQNFTAAGSWDKIGQWFNPTNVKGAYGEFSYPIMSNLKLNINGEMLALIDGPQTPGTTAWGQENDKIVKAEAGVKWGLSKANSVTADYEMVRYESKTDNVDAAVETYLTLGLRHEIGANAFAKIGYQFMNYDAGNKLTAGTNDYAASRGVVQIGVSF